ncbi:MAG: hypothetical protein C0613_15810 [Desulfobulbaceae bacterium]|nr:MAG: hypothetical protein C0613_15810 [Desulfobulbaceae bacterium]
MARSNGLKLFENISGVTAGKYIFCNVGRVVGRVEICKPTKGVAAKDRHIASADPFKKMRKSLTWGDKL